MNEQVSGQLTLFPGDSHASLLVLPGSEKARMMTVTSGRKCSELYRRSGPLGSLVRMCLGSSRWRSRSVPLEWKAEALTDYKTLTIMKRYFHDKKTRCSSASSEILNVSVTKSRYLLFRLVPLTPRTEEIESPLLPTPVASLGDHGGPNQRDRSGRPGLQMAAMFWQTPVVPNGGRVNPPDMSPTGIMPDGKKRQVGMEHQVRMVEKGLWPTPTRFDASCGDLKGKEYQTGSRHAMKLIQAAKLLPTPRAQSATGPSDAPNRQGGADLQSEVNGLLNPPWVEWLMGYPIGWTELSASETP